MTWVALRGDGVEVPIVDGLGLSVTCAECGQEFEKGDKGVIRPQGFNLAGDVQLAWMVLVHEECQ